MVIKIILASTLGQGLFPPLAGAAVGQLWDRPGLLKDFFPDAERVDCVTVDVSGDLGERLNATLGYSPIRPDGSTRYPVWVGWKEGRPLGFALIDDEKGMHEPITFAVLVGPDGAIRRQEVMVYREPAGDGVSSRRFTRQFIGKTVKDPIRDGVDISIVSSATISSHSIAVGVRRAVTIITLGIIDENRFGQLAGR